MTIGSSSLQFLDLLTKLCTRTNVCPNEQQVRYGPSQCTAMPFSCLSLDDHLKLAQWLPLKMDGGIPLATLFKKLSQTDHSN